MARGEGNVGRYVNKDLPSTSEEALSRANATRVITWLKLVGESKVNAFWKKFYFLPNV